MGAQAPAGFIAQFVAKWGPGGPSFGLNEEQGAQQRFIGWADYTPQMPDEEILRRLLALNRETVVASGCGLAGAASLATAYSAPAATARRAETLGSGHAL